MNDWVEIVRDERHIKKERAKARQMRKTPYFQELFRQGICYYCKEKFPEEELTLDHIVPVVRGGKSTKGNMVVCCKSCNQEKRYYTPAEQILNQDNEVNQSIEAQYIPSEFAQEEDLEIDLAALGMDIDLSEFENQNSPSKE
jgi:CRISPR/Cas system Type II protein with McrA/HNH and RuvC-like nuclease domain